MLRSAGPVAGLVPSVCPRCFHRMRKSNSAPKSKFAITAERKRPEDNNRARSRKGKSVENQKRRKGRPAWQRKPDDTPFRDGNRDRLVGLLTERAARTLCYYLSETNLNVHHWLMTYMQKYPIPRSGAWDDVSGETFLRKLLSMPTEHAKWTTIRSQVALEFIEDLKEVSEENSVLLRESLVASLSLSFDTLPVAEKDTLPVADKDSSTSA
ncbi:MAG: hypothetical protein FRX49_00979 [Trebouxia sp. A1-2]|nr:MAG: hypothetical protein FRX49_00979 [Trebouxia sp. A1-2]